MRVCVCACVRVRACVRACVRAVVVVVVSFSPNRCFLRAWKVDGSIVPVFDTTLMYACGLSIPTKGRSGGGP